MKVGEGACSQCLARVADGTIAYKSLPLFGVWLSW